MQKLIKELINFATVIICLSVFFTISPQLASALVTVNAGPDQENVGFETRVQLDGTGSTGTAPLTYTWEQSLGLRVVLSNHTSPTPTFTTPTMSDMILDHEQETFGILGIEPNFLEVEFQLTATDATGQSDTDLVVITLMEPIRTTGLSNVAVGTPVYLFGPASQATFNWTLQGPFFSQSTLSDANTRFPHFKADGTGDYTVTETTTGQSIAIHAATWSGIRQCSACHAGQLAEDKVTPWLETGHATFFTEAIDGVKSSHYNSGCIECHVLGYDTSEEADNGGFDDLADGFWTFPETLQEGNWDDMVENYPELANLANIQCEHCHGPGSDHFGESETIAKGWDESICGFCHNEGHYHVKNEQLRNAAHSTVILGSPVEREPCTGCHTGQGFVNEQIRGLEPGVPEDPQPQICQTCHDPHDNPFEHQLRAYGSAELPNGVMVENAGAGAICMMCHNSRRVASEVLAERSSAPHHSTAAEMLAGTNAMEIPGVTYTDSFHSGDDFVTFFFSDEGDDVNNKCVTCHMAENSVTAQSHVTGQHSFNMTGIVNGRRVQNLDACNICHINLTSLNRRARGDYDGDGTLEGIQSEVLGLLVVLRNAINSSVGGTFEAAHGRIEFHDGNGDPIEPTEAQYVAAYNYQFVLEDGSFGIHNTAYAVKLLQEAYRLLTGQLVPNATPRPDMEPFLNINRRTRADS